MNSRVLVSPKRVWVFVFVVFILFVVATSGLASPSAYPMKAIDIVVPFAPGGGTDLTVRVLAEALSKKWKQAVNILNKPGGNCVIGTNYVMRAAPDGYTILYDGGASSSLQILMTDLPYKLEERTFLGGSNALAGVFVVASTSPWKTLSDVAAAAKKDPGSFTWASFGGSSQADLQMRQFFAAAGIEVSKTKAIAFPGGAGPVINAVAGGHVQLGAASANAPLPMMSSGLIRCIAITSPRRVKELPNVPTTSEQGFPTVNTVYWGGFSGPPGLPEEVVKVWVQTLKEILSDQDLVSKLEKLNIMPWYLGPDDLKKYIAEESQAVKKFLGGK